MKTLLLPTYLCERRHRDYQKRLKHATQPGYGMGKGKNTLIHKGKKP